MKEDGFSLGGASIAIIGLGLMGGSLAMALKGHCHSLLGLDADPAIVKAALERGLVDNASTDPAAILPGVDLIILAAPVSAIVEWLRKLPRYITRPCIVLDIGSVKRAITPAMEELPRNFEPAGGHPICGRERLTLQNASPDLYRDATFVLTPLARTTPRALSAVREILTVIGAHPLELTPEEHDRILASTSHLPFLLASALAMATPVETASLIGPGFRSSARLAGTPASMMLGVVRSNRDNILHCIDRFRGSLSLIETALRRDDDPALESILNEARLSYEGLLNAVP